MHSPHINKLPGNTNQRLGYILTSKGLTSAQQHLPSRAHARLAHAHLRKLPWQRLPGRVAPTTGRRASAH